MSQKKHKARRNEMLFCYFDEMSGRYQEINKHDDFMLMMSLHGENLIVCDKATLKKLNGGLKC